MKNTLLEDREQLAGDWEDDSLMKHSPEDKCIFATIDEQHGKKESARKMYQLPNKGILTKSPTYDEAEQQEKAAKEGEAIVDELDQLGARCEVDDIDIASQVITYSCIAAEKVRVRDIPKLAPELQYTLGAYSVKINAPRPGSKYITIEVPNPSRKNVLLGDVIDSAISPLTFPLGIDTTNHIILQDIKNAPHILVAGVTGAGKSICLHSMICSLLMATTPDDLVFHMVDTKMIELDMYNGIPGLICPVVTDAYEAVEHFQALVGMMEDRYSLAQEVGGKSLDEININLSPAEKLPYILVVVDEIADLMYLSKHNVEESIVRIAQKARAVGIHLILATQSPRREVVTGLLKANLPTRIAFSTSSELDSRIIIDKNGAGSLIGLGDMLYSDQGRSPVRIQSPFISRPEIEAIVSHCKSQNINERIAA